ncbi:unnamed protein product, partial [Prorocentrum cordatum]
RARARAAHAPLRPARARAGGRPRVVPRALLLCGVRLRARPVPEGAGGRPSRMPKSNGNMWNMAGNACNRLVAERMEMRKHEAHLRALENTRGAVDSKKPRRGDHVHLRHKAKTKKLQEDRAADIQLENRILLQKMLSIDTKPSQAFKDLQAPPPARTLHGVAQRRELDRITDANQSLLQRLQNAKPTIDPIKWEDRRGGGPTGAEVPPLAELQPRANSEAAVAHDAAEDPRGRVEHVGPEARGRGVGRAHCRRARPEGARDGGAGAAQGGPRPRRLSRPPGFTGGGKDSRARARKLCAVGAARALRCAVSGSPEPGREALYLEDES